MMNTSNGNTPSKSEDTLEVAKILGITPDDAAEMNRDEGAFAFGFLKNHADDSSVSADLLGDASQID